ncbi:SRPBCC family protein [Paradesertivirga mongoliensis]|uniref:SRPBCC family protein n=1 Tax=Paradesertivirga mongoliensis TaxID=2100740 RepID=A0ABW4ZPG4_9SPHI|nr:SRPBCC family protein [Pedobacter mongoliensis]
METTLIVLAVIIGAPLIIALFLSKDYGVEAETVVNKRSENVFNYIRYIKNQELYSKWVMADLEMKREYRGADGSPGFIYAWNGNNKAGEGEQEITGITENEKLDLEIRFKRPFEGKAYTSITTQAVEDNKTRVTWKMTGRNNYPLNLMTLLLKGTLKKDLEISLNNLKNILEKNQTTVPAKSL